MFLNPHYEEKVTNPDKKTNGKHRDSSSTVRKHPVSIALSNRISEKIDKEASKQKRSRSEYVELHFETIFFQSIET